MHRGGPDRVEESAPRSDPRARRTRPARTAGARCWVPARRRPPRAAGSRSRPRARRSCVPDRRPSRCTSPASRARPSAGRRRPPRRCRRPSDRAGGRRTWPQSSPCSTNQRGVLAGTSPAADPSTDSHGGPPSGTKVARSSSYRSPPPIERQSPRFGFQPPETASRSTSNASSPPSVVRTRIRSSRSAAQRLDHQLARTRVDRPHDVDAGVPEDVGDPEAPARSWRTPPRVRPVARRSAPRRSAAAPASMTPGRSFPANAIGRSIAPVARTTRLGADVPQGVLGVRQRDLVAFVR